MKKFTTSIMIIIITLCLCFTSTGCLDFFSSSGLGNNNSELENNKMVLQIHINEETISVNAYEDEQVTIEKLAIKQGYYLTGYFDAPNGGTKFFDSDGNSLSVWSKSNPTEFYAQWGDIDNFVLTQEHKWDDQNYFSYYSYIYFNFCVTDGDKVSAIAGNLSRKLHLTISFSFKETNDPNAVRTLSIKDNTGSAGEVYEEINFAVISTEYNDFIFDIEVSANAFSKTTYKDRPAYITYFKFNGPDMRRSYIKNISISSMYFLPKSA